MNEQLELFPEARGKPCLWEAVEMTIPSQEFLALYDHVPPTRRGFSIVTGPWIELERVKFYCEQDRAGDEHLIEGVGQRGLSERTLNVLRMKLGLSESKSIQVTF